MALYEKRDDVYCGSCGHFTRHYIWRDGRQARNAPNGCFLPLSLGHCAHPRMKDRREDQSCPCGSPAPRTRTRRTPGCRVQTRRTAESGPALFYPRFSSFRSWVWNASGRSHHSSTSSPVRGCRNRSPTA